MKFIFFSLILLLSIISFSCVSAESPKEISNQIQEFKKELELCKNPPINSDLAEWKKESTYSSVNGTTDSIKKCYVELYHQITKAFYSNNKDQAEQDLNNYIKAVKKSYLTLYADLDVCQNKCGRIIYDMAAQSTNEAIADFISLTLNYIEFKYKN